MSIRVQCTNPDCTASFSVAGHHAAEQVRCPQCRTLTPVPAADGCRSSIPMFDDEPSTPSASPIACTSCGATIDARATHCPGCGAGALAGNRARARRSGTPSTKRRARRLSGLFLLMASLVASGVLFLVLLWIICAPG